MKKYFIERISTHCTKESMTNNLKEEPTKSNTHTHYTFVKYSSSVVSFGSDETESTCIYSVDE